MSNVGEQIIANFLSYGIAIGIFWFLAKKYFGNLEERLNRSEEDNKETKERVYEIEHNYIDRFDAVNKKLEDNKGQILNKIDEINTDKINFRMRQVEKMATIENKVDNITREIERNNKP